MQGNTILGLFESRSYGFTCFLEANKLITELAVVCGQIDSWIYHEVSCWSQGVRANREKLIQG